MKYYLAIKWKKNMIHVMTWINLKIIMLHERSQTKTTYNISSVQFSPSIMSDSLSPHGLQHTRLPCPSPTSRACSNSCPLSWWCHPTISSSVVPFSSHLQSFPASGSFPKSQFFMSGGQSIGALSFSIRLSNEYSGLISFRIDCFDLLYLYAVLENVN